MAKDKHEDLLLSMSLGDHLEELRMRLMLAIAGIFGGMVIGMIGANWVINFLVMQYTEIMEKAGKTPNLLLIQISDPMLLFLKVSLVIGVVLSSPWILYQLWAFVSAGLYKHEKKYVYSVLPASTILFLTGAVFFFKAVAPVILKFLVTFDFGLPDIISYTPTVPSYVNFILNMSLVFGIAFQLPILIIFANKLGLVSVEMLNKGRKYVILGVFVVAAVLTPPDFISQILLAVPMLFLYEGSVIFCIISGKKKKAKAQEDES